MDRFSQLHHFQPTSLAQTTIPLTSIPGVQSISGVRKGETVHVSPGTMDTLLKANEAIDTTRKILNYGSGNQYHDIASTDGQSYRRTLGSRIFAQQTGASRMEAAVQFKAGNCGEMASVNAAVLAYSGINQPVSVVSANEIDHSFVVIGDKRVNAPVVISDAWPLFGRADLADNFALSRNYTPDETYAPHSANQERLHIMQNAELPEEQLNHHYRAGMAAENAQHILDGADGYNAAGAMTMMNGKVYSQLTAARDISQRYQGSDSNGVFHTIGHEVSRDRYDDAMHRLHSNMPHSNSSQGHDPMDTD